MSRQPGQDYPDILLERYLAGDLGEELRAEIGQACERSEILRARLDELTRERDAFLTQDPPEQFAHRLAAELHSDPKPTRSRRWLAWLLAPSAAAAAAALLVTLVAVRSERSHLSNEVSAPAMAPPTGTAQPTTPALVAPAEEPEADMARADAKDELASRIYPVPVMDTPAKPVATSASRTPAAPLVTKKSKARKRSWGAPSGGGGGGRVGEDKLFDAPPRTPKPKSKPAKSSPAPAPAAESFMAEPADRGSRRSLAKADIMSGVKQGIPKVMPCIKRARQNGELEAGRHTFVLSWTIEPSGRVSSPKLVGPASVLGTSLPACFARGMGKWRFPASAKAAPVRNFPFGPFSLK